MCIRDRANTPYTIRHFSNNPILIRKVASYGGVITMAGSMIVSIDVYKRQVPSAASVPPPSSSTLISRWSARTGFPAASTH